MTKKIFLSIILISFFASVAAIMLSTAVVSIESSSRIEEELDNQCSMIAALIEENGTEILSPKALGDAAVRLEAKGGRIIFDSTGDTDCDLLISASRHLSDGTQVTVFACDDRLGQQLIMNLNSLLVILATVILCALAAAIVVTRRIIRPINEIDLDAPETSKSYKELSPLLAKLRSQNRRVYHQMEELRSSRQQFSLITESMSEGIVVADPKSVILACNSGACRLLEAEQVSEGQSIFALSPSEQFRRCIQDAMGGRNSECILSTAGGDRKIIASPASISETINGIVVFILDVTEQQKLETMRREFTSNVSHELKTPLTTIYGISDMLANGMVKPEDVSSFGGDIRHEAERLINLIGDIVSLSKLDENSVPEQDEEVDLYELSGEIIARLSHAAEEKGVTASLTGEHVTVTGNRTILDEMITNLCDNAVKYNREGGRYEVHISHIPTKAMITVRDNGIGIPAEHIDRIFERFYRADKSHSRKVKGTGLGLSIVKHGVMYHGGTVKVSSSGGETVFTVELPVNRV